MIMTCNFYVSMMTCVICENKKGFKCVLTTTGTDKFVLPHFIQIVAKYQSTGTYGVVVSMFGFHCSDRGSEVLRSANGYQFNYCCQIVET